MTKFYPHLKLVNDPSPFLKLPPASKVVPFHQMLAVVTNERRPSAPSLKVLLDDMSKLPTPAVKLGPARLEDRDMTLESYIESLASRGVTIVRSGGV